MGLFSTRPDRWAPRCGLAAACGMMAIVTTTVARADFTENFDGVTAPALPAGWTATNATGPAPLWVTTTTLSDSGPNNAFIDDPDAVVSDKRLDTPPIPIATTTAVLTFRNNYSLNGSGSSTEGFDGGVLEISIDGGAFQDILTAGGSFVGGGYTHTINPGFMNPIGGRMAWSGTSAGYITTTVNLPAAAAGKNIVLRFRMGSNNSSGPFPGWHVDSIRIDDCTITCPANITVPLGPGQCATVVNYPAPTTLNDCGVVSCVPPSGSSFPLGTTTITCAASENAICTFTVTVEDPDPDRDGDGVTNCVDGCPDDAQKTAPGACGCGVSDSDANGNGTPDCNDPPPAPAACGTCAQGIVPATFLSLAPLAWRCRRPKRRRRRT
jgi:hypothetical protein